MKKFLNTFQQSIASKIFYRDLENRSLRSSIGYYFGLIFLITIITTLVVSWNLLPAVRTLVKNIGPTIINYYPEDLEITIKDGVASHSEEDPVFVPFVIPNVEGFPAFESSSLPFRYAVVIDTKNTFDIKKFEEYETLVYLSKDYLVTANGEGRVEDLVALKDFPQDITINRQAVLSFIGELQPFVNALPVILFFLVFIGLFVLYGFSFIRVLLAALILMIIYRLAGLKRNFSKSYQVALHASTLALIVSSLFIFINIIPDVRIPFLFTALTVIIGTLMMPPAKSENGPLLADQK
ncbi:MAG: DUF1189 family protein [Anaplasmataceae bacterium]|nr:DUF1189 family protein [Anaplasmataceae bacterium]